MTSSEDQFLALLEQHQRILYKVAHAYCRKPEDLQDLLQEMTIQLWRSFGRYDGRVQFSTWMFRVAMNVAISFYRSERRRPQDSVPIDQPGLQIAAADQLLGDTGDDLRLLRQLIAGLDELNRALIILYLDGYDHQTIAEIVGITTTNVATRISRIKQTLQRQFQEANHES